MNIRNDFKRMLMLACALLLAAGAAQADTWDTIAQRKKAVIAIDLGAPPFGMNDSNLQPSGSEVETARQIAKDMGVALEIVPVTSTNRVPYLLTNKVDMVVSVFGITPEREKVVSFSLPYTSVLSVVAGPQGASIKSFADLSGKRIAATRGTTNDQELTKGAPKDAQIVRFDDDATLITALLSGQLDYIATAPALIDTINRKDPARKLETKFVMKVFPIGVGVRKEDTRLREWLDQWVRTNLKNGRLNEIFKKWHGTSLPDEIMKNAQ